MDAKAAADKKQEVEKNMKNESKSIVNYDPSADALYMVTRGGDELGAISRVAQNFQLLG